MRAAQREQDVENEEQCEKERVSDDEDFNDL